MKPTIAKFLIIAFIIALASFFLMSTFAPAFAVKYTVSIGVSVIIGVFVSAGVCVILEPVGDGKYVILPSNI
jgi:polyferredoxin